MHGTGLPRGAFSLVPQRLGKADAGEKGERKIYYLDGHLSCWSLGREGFSSAMTGLKGTSVSVSHSVLLAGSWHTGKENPSLTLGFSTTLLNGRQMSMTSPHLLPTHLSQMAG